MKLEAAIYDMDGLLTESESKWRIAEHEVCAELGLSLGDEDFVKTQGLRMREVAQLWFEWEPWEGLSTDEVAERVVHRVMELCAESEPLPGVVDSIDMLAASGLRLAVCSSSDLRMIESIVGSLGLTDRFELLHSAEHDAYGKPHPEPYLTTAAKLGVDPQHCLVFEDSVAGCVSGKAAKMNVVAVPDPLARGSAKFGFADVVLESLEQFDAEVLSHLEAGTEPPTLARPRFHLAFPVDDLDTARHFYGDVLQCREGRSADTWVDFDLWGHQVVAHLDPAGVTTPTTNDVDGKQVPASHFGALLHIGAWRDLVERMQAASVTFLIEPNVRFAGEAGEQHTCFVLDPAGNALEFKAFADDRQVFAT